MLEDRTAGTWRTRVLMRHLGAKPHDKETNNAAIESLVKDHPAAIVVAAANLCGAWLEDEYLKVKRLSKDRLHLAVKSWIESEGLSWRLNAEKCSQRGSFKWQKIDDWCNQFRLVDPERGHRVAAAILSQLKVATVAEMADWFDGLPPVDHSVFFIGADPHSGDHGLVNILSARIEGPKLIEATKLQLQTANAEVRLFADAAWSGGESERRLECLYKPCNKKASVIGHGNKLHLRFAYLTTTAQEALTKKINVLEATGACSPNSVQSSCPENNLLHVNPTGKTKGLAFQRKDLNDYVDPANSSSMRDICKSIGVQIAKKRPLGTDDVASTIMFEHSIPRAVLPVLIFGGAKVKAHDGTEFVWKALVGSSHVEKPANADNDVHCKECPLVRDERAAREAQAAEAAQGEASAAAA